MVLIYPLRSKFAKIWDYVDLDKAENEIKENNELDVPSIVAAPVVLVAAPTAPVAAPVAPVAAPAAPAVTLSTGTATPRLLS
jgi:hypothetical protein